LRGGGDITPREQDLTRSRISLINTAMPYRPKIVTRDISASTVSADLTPKGSGLTNGQMDSNFLNLRDQSIGIKGSDSTVFDIKAGDTVTFTNATITTDSTGTFVETGGGAETVTALTSSTAITVDCSLGTVFTVTLAHNTTFRLTNFSTGQAVALRITQDGTGNRVAAFVSDTSTAVKFAFGDNLLSTAASKIDFVSIFNDGTNLLGAINRAYA
jgi:hypothetical protein